MFTPTTPHPVLKKYYAGEGDRQPFVTAMFDSAARDYNRVCDLGSLGSGRFYRRWALRKAGLRPGMTLLDLATGTGLVAMSAARIGGSVIGIDPSEGMLGQARKTAGIRLVRGTAEALPFRDDRFDLVSVGYALRHFAELGVTFRECLRVLKPGCRLLVLEISRPESAALRWIVRVHMQRVLPLIMRVGTRSGRAGLLTRYFWDTIAECVPPATILDVLRASGFVDVERRARGGFLSEYTAAKPRRDSAARSSSGIQNPNWASTKSRSLRNAIESIRLPRDRRPPRPRGRGP